MNEKNSPTILILLVSILALLVISVTLQVVGLINNNSDAENLSQPVITIVLTPTASPQIFTGIPQNIDTPEPSQPSVTPTQMAPESERSQTVVPTVESTSVPEITPTISLPVAVTVTPLPPKPVIVTITNESATIRAQEYISDNSIPIEDMEVRFTNDRLEFSGMVSTGIFSSDQLLGIAEPIVEDEKLTFEIVSVSIGSETTDEYDENIEQVLNSSFLSILLGRLIQKAEVNEGNLSINALELDF